jgi:ornithine carbamoyltransferase
MIRHFLRITDFNPTEIADLLELAASFKATRSRTPSHLPSSISQLPSPNSQLQGQTWALLFHKASTRTRVSFEAGIHELGGHPMVLDTGSLQMGRGETVEDTARVLSRYIHGIIIRTYRQELIEAFAAAGTIPVINALTDQQHPCQVYADALTLAERWTAAGTPLLEGLRGRSLAYIGDCASNMAHAWILAAPLLGMQLRLSGPAAYAPQAWVAEALAAAGLQPAHQFTTDPHAAARAADAVYTDVWVSMGDEAEQEQRLRAFAPYQVDAGIMAAAAPAALFLHCLPAHEGQEVSTAVYRGPQSIVYDQAENRLHMQKAILATLAAHAANGGHAS